MVGHVNSLNASVAASLMMYEVFRKKDMMLEKYNERTLLNH